MQINRERRLTLRNFLELIGFGFWLIVFVLGLNLIQTNLMSFNFGYVLVNFIGMTLLLLGFGNLVKLYYDKKVI